MNYSESPALQQFKNQVAIKFQLYNSLFTSLPFHRIEKTGILLSLLLTNCEDGYKKKMSPAQIIDEFFHNHTAYAKEEEKLDLLFRFVQFAERQVVLFDALEDAGFSNVHDMSGPGTLKSLQSEIIQNNKQEELAKKLEDFAVRLVLTAHPTQFYPGPVLGIINDLSKAIEQNNVTLINTYLQQLGKTPFFNKQKPSPYDEAMSLIWYMENIFYPTIGRIITFLRDQFGDVVTKNNPVINMGFWPGGDRDGNPFVTYDTTLKVADALRGSIIKCYYQDVRRIKRRLTFSGVDVILNDLEKKLYNNIFIPGQKTDLTKEEIVASLQQIRQIIIYKHNGLFLHLVNNLINKVEVFGLHFASLDIRQDSAVHGKVLNEIARRTQVLPADYEEKTDEEKMELLLSINQTVNSALLDDPIAKDTIEVIRTIKTIQQYNGSQGCERYIISQCTSALNAIEVFGLFLLSGWKKGSMNVDIIPLFETIDDLKHAASVMQSLYENDVYKKHLAKRNNNQTIMLGFSDGTKDGGYMMANWSIFKAKEELTAVSKQYGIDVIFFDGRGGPPARGGGKTHKFYSSLGNTIANKEIQLTIQGQTVSSNFGIIDSAQYNIEQLINAGISNDIFSARNISLKEDEKKLFDELSKRSFDCYMKLKNHPYFLDYLGHVSPLRFYAQTNIGSRPAKRGASARITLRDLRAIPFVGAWSQIKQNLTGYYGVGTALKEMDEAGRLDEVRALYKNSAFFKALMDNCEMSMKKCFFPLTQFLSDHKIFGELWNTIHDEYELTKKYILMLAGKSDLMWAYPVEQLSVQMRERIVLPLTTIQQYAITKVREMEEQMVQPPIKKTYEKLVMRCSFGIINAGRNSA